MHRRTVVIAQQKIRLHTNAAGIFIARVGGNDIVCVRPPAVQLRRRRQACKDHTFHACFLPFHLRAAHRKGAADHICHSLTSFASLYNVT